MLLFVVFGAIRCKTSISETDLTQQEAIYRCHQTDHISWLDYTDNCAG